ncbi:MAG: amidohydrolase family protein [Bryobacteraceae bacterium]
MRRLLALPMLGSCILIAWAALSALDHAQGQTTPEIVVVDGGTLIDGNGGAPASDVQVVIQGNRISKIGKRGDAIPAGAQVIRADGKWIVPGLWDAQLNFYSYHGEAMLNTGNTSFIGIGDDGETGVLMHEGILAGKILAPRPFDAPVHFQEFANLNGLESPYQQLQVLKTPEEAREWTHRILALGADIVSFQNGRAGDQVVQAAFEEAHKSGKATIIRSGGPEILPRKAAELGADIIPHSLGVAIEVASDKMPPLPPVIRQVVQPGEVAGIPAGVPQPDELEIWSWMDDAKVPAEIKYLVDHHVNLVPTFIEKAMGLQKGWARFEAEDRLILGNEALETYYPEERRLTLLGNYAGPVHLRPRNREVHMKGYQNALRFHKMYVEAGGHVLAGTDGGNNATPGPAIHHEIENLVDDAGLTPMQAIESATKWPAEAVKAEKDLGTVETGKLADLVIVNANPLQSIQKLNDIAKVIYNGRPLDGKYHAYYNASNPFGGSGFAGLPMIENLGFTLIVKKANYREGRVGGVAPGRLPQPGITAMDTQRHDFEDSQMSKVTVREGSPTLRLKIEGFNFFDRTQVFFNDMPIPYELKGITEIEAIIDETLLRRPGRYAVYVRNPPPAANLNWGNGTSNLAWLLVSYKDSLTASSPLKNHTK